MAFVQFDFRLIHQRLRRGVVRLEQCEALTGCDRLVRNLDQLGRDVLWRHAVLAKGAQKADHGFRRELQLFGKRGCFAFRRYPSFRRSGVLIREDLDHGC